MIVPFKPIRAVFGKDVVVQEGFVVEHTESGPMVRSEEVYTDLKENEDRLNLCFSVHIQHAAILRSGPINTLNKAREFLVFALERHKILVAQYQKIQRKPRIVCTQLDDPLLDWEKIRLQHVFLAMAAYEAKLEFNVAHMSLPTEKFFERIDIPQRTTFQKKNTEKLARELNWYAWLQYALWISEEMEILLEKFGLDASSTYQIESFCRDFIHEARSVLMIKSLKEVQELSLQYADLLLKRNTYGANAHSPNESNQLNQKIVDVEKEIFKASLPLKESLKRILEIVLKIESEAVRKDRIREEYIPIRRMILLYRKILQTQIEPTNTPQQPRTSWCQQAMLRILLDDELMIVTSVDCSTGIEKSNLTYSIHVAVLELKHKFPPDRVIDMAFNWISSTPKFNKVIHENGFDGSKEWLKTEPTAEELVQTHRRAHVIDKLRKIYFRVLMDLCLPIQQLCIANAKVEEEEQHLQAHTSYLNLLPAFLEMKYDDGDVESIPYVVYDAETGDPTKLSETGYRTLSRFRF